MIKAILAVDDKGGVSKKGSMPWPHNQKDLNWFKKNTINQVVIMGRTTWDDLKEKKPLPSRINALVTSQESKKFPGADIYIKGDLEEGIKNIKETYPKLTYWIIGGPNLVNQLFCLINEFYLTKIYGDFNCDTFLDLTKINNEMKISQRIECDKSCHFEIWKK